MSPTQGGERTLLIWLQESRATPMLPASCWLSNSRGRTIAISRIILGNPVEVSPVPLKVQLRSPAHHIREVSHSAFTFNRVPDQHDGKIGKCFLLNTPYSNDKFPNEGCLSAVTTPISFSCKDILCQRDVCLGLPWILGSNNNKNKIMEVNTLCLACTRCCSKYLKVLLLLILTTIL